jgi:AraC-like DNA-binding protein
MHAAAPALPETGYPMRRPMLVSWGARALYLGPPFQMPPHRNAVAVLALALDGALELAHDPDRPENGFRRCRSVLVEPGQLHLLRTDGRECAFLYVDALSHDLDILRSACGDIGERASFDLWAEDKLIALLANMERSEQGWDAVSGALTDMLGLMRRARPDRRIYLAVQSLARNPGDDNTAASLAEEAGMSSSYFQHKFKLETGVPFRRFRNWIRLRAVLKEASLGAALTVAAQDAGYASSAHLSVTFKEMFGMPPSQLLAAKPMLIEKI